MAFCPNCGTPNTDQAEKCVACGYELSSPKQKAKFKGTIMMSGIKAPTAPAAPGEPPTQAAAPSAATPPASTPPASAAAPQAADPSTSSEAGRNVSLQRTMLGHAPLRPAQPPGARPAEPGVRPPGSSLRSSDAGARSSDADARAADSDARPPAESGVRVPVELPQPPADFSRAPTMQGPAAQFTPGPRPPATGPQPVGTTSDFTPPRQSAASGAGTSFGATGGWGQSGAPSYPTLGGGAAVDSTFPPAASKPGPGKILAIGCAAVLVLSCVIGGLLYFVLADKLKALLAEGSDSGAEAVAWQASIGQSLAQVTALCQTDCGQAGVFFHPQVQGALLGEAKALTPNRVQKLSDPRGAKAAMLDATDDRALATALGLDPQQCARVMVDSAKVVSCSVPDAGGKPSVLRIVHMSGIGSL